MGPRAGQCWAPLGTGTQATSYACQLLRQILRHPLCDVTRSLGYHCTMEDLPDEILLLIARQVLEKEEGMKLWCKLASTCTRLWSFQLPAEPVYVLDNRVKEDGTSRCCHDNA